MHGIPTEGWAWALGQSRGLGERRSAPHRPPVYRSEVRCRIRLRPAERLRDGPRTLAGLPALGSLHPTPTGASPGLAEGVRTGNAGGPTSPLSRPRVRPYPGP